MAKVPGEESSRGSMVQQENPSPIGSLYAPEDLTKVISPFIGH